ncbi:conserved hypothetical protein [Ruegeria lacuscaerulensis ITI-1157]|nr:conserved hypothetical protein [Ruegeria lacuscaerulensis ITI-1157]SHJ73273.1 hypothetical protein SAMN05444404_2523 [Ruegeria lacuscaerulensis ITI-1157]
MSQAKLSEVRFQNAIWEGFIACQSRPQVEARYLDEPLAGVEVAQAEGGWTVRAPVPSALLSEGVHGVTIQDAETHETLGAFTVIAGAPAADDLRAEVNLLRAELDMLKRVVRRLHHDQD